jgi:hypothetical protein
VIIGLKTVKGTKQLKLDPTIYDALIKEKVIGPSPINSSESCMKKPYIDHALPIIFSSFCKKKLLLFFFGGGGVCGSSGSKIVGSMCKKGE